MSAAPLKNLRTTFSSPFKNNKMKKLLFLLAFISCIGIDAKADVNFTNNTSCDLRIELYCRDCWGPYNYPIIWGPYTIPANGSLNVPGNASCGNGETRVARICYDSPSFCTNRCVEWVNFTPGVPAPLNCDVYDTYVLPACCAIKDIILEWTATEQFVARFAP